MSPRVVWLETAGSTNTEALDQARLGVPHGWAVAARQQTNGRGRLGRRWDEAIGNLMMSVVLRPTIAPDQLPWITLGAGVVVAELLGDPFRLKWPNDVLDGQRRKVAGILAEAEWARGALEAMVVGIGVNIVNAPAGVNATCLADHGSSWTRETLADALADRLTELDPTTVADRWRARSCTLGHQVTIGAATGLAVDVDVDGALIVETGNGRERVISGDLGFVSDGARAR